MSSNNNNGIWDQWQADTYHQSSQKLADYLKIFLPNRETVIDFGCGNAFYISELAKDGFHCIGVEGFKLSNFLHKNIVIADISRPLMVVDQGLVPQKKDEQVFGSVISLEVGEHLPKESEQIFLDNLTSHVKTWIVLSWALPGQPGVGHINCQPQEYIINEIERRGFNYRPFITNEARKHIDDNTDWFRRTLLIFKKNE